MTEELTSGPPPPTEQSSTTADLSNAMVGLYKELFGRGPTQARTVFAGPDLLICTLEQSLTPAERSLAAMGEHQRLRDIRLLFQHARAADFSSLVERITGREVRAFVSGMDVDQDVSSEVFYLVPLNSPRTGGRNGDGGDGGDDQA